MGECWRGCFDWKEMLCSWVIPSRRSRIMGRLGLSGSPPSVLLSIWFTPCFQRDSFLMCWILPLLGGQPKSSRRLCPPVGIGSVWNSRGSWFWEEADRWLILETADRCGSVPYKLLKAGLETPRGALTPSHVTDTYRPVGWVGLLFTKTTGNITAVNIFSILFVCFCVSLLSVFFNLTVKETVHQKKKKTLLLTCNAEFELLRAFQVLFQQ